MEDFVHLHVHTQYSILDGQASVSSLLRKAMGDGMRGMAVTDHGNMMAIKEFFNKSQSLIKEARAEAEQLRVVPEGETDEARLERERKLADAERKAAFKPVFGCEMYVARRGMHSKEGKEDQSGYHLIVLAKNKTGYHNLLKLVSNAWTDGFYMRPRTDREQLKRYREGLIVSSACLAGEIPRKILQGDIAGAEEAISWFKETFGTDYYLELQRHEVKDPAQRANRDVFPDQQAANRVLVELAHKHGVKLICTNDVHFTDEENAEAHDRLICLSTGKDIDDPARMLYSKQEWFKTRAEMNDIFADLPEALSNTIEVLDKVETYSIDHAPIMPTFDIPATFGTEEEYKEKYTDQDLLREFSSDENGHSIMSEAEGRAKIEKLGGFERVRRIKFEADYLTHLTYEGAKQRYGNPVPGHVDERLRFELHVMKTMGFPGYFLIVQDYINVARTQLDVSVGPGRGSAAGSCAAYCLGITQIDPLEYDLLFERFLNPDRISLPDIDVDFDDDGRGRLLKWVTEKYGEENCAHIITYGTMATKMALKDVARVENVPLAESNRLCKLIPDRLPGKQKITLDNAIAAIPELREAEASNDKHVRNTFRYAKMLEGNVRNTGVHACGFIICKDKISDWVPVSTADDKETGEKVRCTQYEGKVIEETGLIKMDFLGLKNLSIIKEAVENIRESLGVEIDIDHIPLNDRPTFQLFSDGNTIGTFQFESAGMQRYLRELQPSTLGDLIAMNALYRPGPMEKIPSFIRRKHGEEKITYRLPCMEKYLKDTYGITVYQEQVMLLSREIADFTRGESDELRKAMGKKKKAIVDKMKPKFIQGGKKNGYEEAVLNTIWAEWESFAEYAFNKSHAACYAWIAYQTGYLKANFPSQYMAGAMSRNLTNISEITKLMDDCKSMGINTLGPDVNESRSKFSVNHEGDIRFGLAGVKGVGTAAVQTILQEREQHGAYKSIYDFMERINLSACNKKNCENLALSGAFDSFGIAREAYVQVNRQGETFLDALFRYGTLFQNEKSNASNTLFGGFDAVEVSRPEPLGEVSLWSDLEKLNRERELIGIYLSGHPLDAFRLTLDKFCNTRAAELTDLSTLVNREVSIGGIVSNVREGTTRNGNPFGVTRIEDYDGSGELALFGEKWLQQRAFLVPGTSILLRGKVVQRRHVEGAYNFEVTSVKLLTEVKKTLIHKVVVSTSLDRLDEEMTEEIASLLKAESGDVELEFHLIDHTENSQITLRSAKYRIDPDGEFLRYVERHPELECRIA